MKKLLIIVLVLLAMVFATGCLPNWLPGVEPDEPEVPELVMEANGDAVLVMEPIVIEEVTQEVIDGEIVEVIEEIIVYTYHVAWSIENIGDLFIREYLLTFSVLYPMEAKDLVIFEVVGNYLEIDEKHEGILDLVPYDTPETVSVSWELFE